MRVFWLIFIIIALSASAAEGHKGDTSLQKKTFRNNVRLSFGDFRANSRSLFKSYNLVGQVGGYYERLVSDRWIIGTGYYQWEDWGRGFDGYVIFGPGQKTGDIDYRKNYRMLDVYGGRKYKIGRKQSISPKLGITYTWGENFILTQVFKNPEPPHDEISFGKMTSVQYWGVVPHVSYDYYFLGGRLGIGIDLRLRQYLGQKENQLDYGFHVGGSF